LLTIVLSYRDMDLNNLKPILHSKPADLASGTLLSFSLPYCEIIVCAPMFGDLNRNVSIFKTFFKGLLFAFAVLFVANLRNTLVLGYSVGIYDFPSYEAVSVIKLGEFFTRMEVLIGINLLLAGFIKSGVLLFSSCEALTKVFGFEDYEPLVQPVSLLILTVSVLIHKNTAEMYAWTDYFPYFSLPFQVILPILVLVVGVIRKKAGKSKQAKEPAKEEKKSAPVHLREN